MRKLARKIHKLVFIYVGIFMLLWVVTGIIMSLPGHRSWVDLTPKSLEKYDYISISLSPSDAVRSLRKIKNINKVKNIRLSTIQGKIMYVIRDDKNKNYLINTKTGAYYHLTLEDAITRVPQVYNIKEPVVESTVQNNHDLGYMWGDLPVYKLRYEGSSDVFYVNPLTGEALRPSLFSQIKAVSSMLHTIEPITKITGSDRIRWMSVVFIGLLSLLGTIFGIYLTFPSRKKT